MIFFCIIFASLILSAKPTSASSITDSTTSEPVQPILESKLVDLDTAAKILLLGETVVRSKDLMDFYEARNRKAAWIVGNSPKLAAWQLMDEVRNCEREGLEPSDYHLRILDSLLSKYNRQIFWQRRHDPFTSASLEILLTDSYLKFARHLLSGRTQPKIPQDIWHVNQEKIELPAYLEKNLNEKKDVGMALKALTPPQVEYGKMKYWLGEYQKLAKKGGWQLIPDGPAMGRDSTGPRVVALCARLKVSGEMGWGACGDNYSAELEKAVKKFQKSHGLDITGVASTSTVKALNISVEERIDQIELNLDS